MIDQAKVEHDESLKQELETERDAAEVEKQLLKERERLRHRDINVAKAEVSRNRGNDLHVRA